MKVLILSITAGEGHNSTATAISDYLISLGAECHILDTYGYLSKLLGDSVSKGYLMSVDALKRPYSIIYKSLEKRKKNGNKISATRVANMVFMNKMEKYLNEYDPDVIISTHIFSAMIIDVLKQKRSIRAKTIGIVTDYTVHPFWEEGIHFDYLVIANEYLSTQAKKKGFSESQILPFGIPIKPKFSNKYDKEQVRKDLGLDPNKTTFLVMSGSMGYGHPEKYIQNLDELPFDYQIISVCGNNKKAKEAIDNLEKKKQIVNFGFSQDIDKYMDAADCIIGKPGGLTTSEALAKGVPMILVNPIPGHEERNAEFLLNAGTAMKVSKMQTLGEIVTEIMSNEEKLSIMREAVALISKPNATKDICEFIMKL